MELFDSEIEAFRKLIQEYPSRELELTADLRRDAGKNNMVFADESAYELGGGTLASVSFELPTSSDLFPNQDRILLIGSDLSEIRQDTPFARITLLKVRDDRLSGDELYERLQKIKFTKYRVSPEGYMLRTATGNHEKVRVSKDAAANSGFSEIGSAYVKAYRQLEFAENVIQVFVTGNAELCRRLKELADKRTRIVDTIDHILKGMLVNDCGSCSVKELCDEVEGMRELHRNQK